MEESQHCEGCLTLPGQPLGSLWTLWCSLEVSLAMEESQHCEGFLPLVLMSHWVAHASCGHYLTMEEPQHCEGYLTPPCWYPGFLWGRLVFCGLSLALEESQHCEGFLPLVLMSHRVAHVSCVLWPLSSNGGTSTLRGVPDPDWPVRLVF